MRKFSKMPTWAIIFVLVSLSKIGYAEEVNPALYDTYVDEMKIVRTTYIMKDNLMVGNIHVGGEVQDPVDHNDLSDIVGWSTTSDNAVGTIEVDEKEINCMAENIYFEARHEPRDGKVAVAQVTVNRIESGQFPDSVCGVVKQKTKAKATGKTVCQFSWYCEGKKRIRYESEQWASALEVARAVLVEGVRLDRLSTAMFYHNTHVNPRWGLQKLTKIGGHIFYSPERAFRTSRK